jgi:hypothetical protein
VKRSIALLAAVATLAGAPALAGPTGPLSIPADTQAELDSQLASTWSTIRPQLEQSLVDAVAQQSGQTHGNLTITKLAVASKDVSAPPRVVISPETTGQHHFLFIKWGTPQYAGERVSVSLPGHGGWSIEIDGHIEYKIDTKILFIHIQKTIQEDVKIVISDLHASDEIVLDTTDPAWPQVKSTGKLKVDFDYKLRTGSFLVNVLLFLTKPIVSPILHHEIAKALQSVDSLLAGAKGAPSTTVFGKRPTPLAPIGTTPDLEKLALQISDDVQQVHTPFGTVVAAVMTDPTYGQGTATSYQDYGDSAIWTGHYLAGESFRYAVNKDPKAEKNAIRAIGAIQDLLDCEAPGDGYLARCLIPTTHPDAAQFVGQPDAFTTTLRGTQYVCLEDISRDQYLGAMHGLGIAHDMLDDPAAKAQCASLITRVVGRLSRDGWCGMRHDRKTVSAPFIQSPEKMIMFSAMAAEVDPSYQTMRNEIGKLAPALWFFSWTSTLDPLSSYYKWNLGNGATYNALRLETDPARYAAIMRAHAIDRRTIGHHENAYFQTIDVALDPSLMATLQPQVLDELRRFAQRSRRGTTVTNSTDPTIEQDYYTAPLSIVKSNSAGGTLGLGSSATIAPTKTLMAKYPVPVEKRCSTDYLWQRNPFELDGSEDPHRQPPGVDMVLPYWMARYYKVLP